MAQLSLFKLYRHADRLSGEWGIQECPGVILRKRCADISSLELLEPLRDVLPGSIQEAEILERIFKPFKNDVQGWIVEVKGHTSLVQWIGDYAPYDVMIKTKNQARSFAHMLRPIQDRVFHTRDDALKALERLVPLSHYLP